MQVQSTRLAGWLKPWGMSLLVFGLVLACYWPSLRGELIWNDREYVPTPQLRSLEGLGRIWMQPGATEQYYPLLYSALWLQCRLWGEQPLGYHLVTLALHAGAAVLFALVLLRLAIPGAWLAALLFALHPVNVESVAWITEQKNTLSLVFYLAAALVYLRFDETRQRSAYIIALGLFLLSLPCKTATSTLPAALLVVLWWKRGRLNLRRDVAPLLPWLAAGAVAGVFTSWVERHYTGANGEDFTLPLLDRGLVAGRALWFYLGHVVWPLQLNFVYPRWEPDPAVFWQWLFPLGAFALAAALWAVRGRTRAPLAAFLLFAGSLFPVLGVVYFYSMRYSWVWDHWQYLPDLGPIAFIAACLTRGWESAAPRWRPLGPALAGMLILALGVLTWRHTGMFHDNDTLYRMTLERNPACWMAHNNLGADLAKSPDHVAEALAHYEAALRIRPDYAEAHNNLAILLAKLPDRHAEALTHYEQALHFQPDFSEAHDNLANLLATIPGREAEAIVHYQEALRIKPDNADAHFNLAGLLAQLPGREAEAIAHYQEALRIKPDHVQAYNNLAVLFARQGRIEEAEETWTKALQIDPNYDDARRNLRLLQQPTGR
jgi:tetratricopeptide (TPR) repeat protein